MNLRHKDVIGIVLTVGVVLTSVGMLVTHETVAGILCASGGSMVGVALYDMLAYLFKRRRP